MTGKTILISGASIAGPALAYWLRRHGFRPTIVERASAPRPGGQAVDIRGAAVDVVERMGLLEEIRANDTDITAMSYVDSEGGTIATLDAAFGVVDKRDVEIAKGELTRILYAATRDNVEYLFGDAITGLTEDANGVQVTFEHAAPRRFDLVIGADGLHSNVRSLAFGDEADFLHHLGLYVSIFSTPNTTGLDHAQQIHATPGRVATLTSARDRDQAKAVFFFGSDPLTYHHRDTATQQRLLADAFADTGWEVPRLLRAMADAPDFYFDSVSQIRMESWHQGRVALVGDAAYASSALSGQGTGQALVGAYVLAGELAAADGDHEVAFARYEAAMRTYVEKNQKLGTANTQRFAPSTSAAIRMQNISLKMLKYLPFKGLLMKAMTKGVADAANSITISDYARPTAPNQAEMVQTTR
ncbi:MAG TPA: FAD-dependent monooxygenase [Pseudonocardiaceae bacterium]|jgi:2-polyprenyl-6-methoxyphenol hydroxylase-like FAD-dependent oxidoreductase